MNRRDGDMGERFSEYWWADIVNAAWSLRHDCDVIMSCGLEMERIAGELGSVVAWKALERGKPVEGVRILGALQRIMDTVSGKLAQEVQVLAADFPQWMDRAYEVEDMYEEEE